MYWVALVNGFSVSGNLANPTFREADFTGLGADVPVLDYTRDLLDKDGFE